MELDRVGWSNSIQFFASIPSHWAIILPSAFLVRWLRFSRPQLNTIKKMANIKEMLTSGANVSVMVNVADLREFFRECSDEVQAERAKYEAERAKGREMLTPYDVMERFGCSKPTLWRWQKTGYLVPVKVGRKMFYRVSDVNKLLEGESA